MSKSSPLNLPNFNGRSKISSADLIHIFNKYDKDRNGGLDSRELDHFLADVVRHAGLQFSVERLKGIILEHYDVDKDGRIQLQELERILPTEKNFLLNFKLQYPLTSVEFMSTWCHYDTDHSGFLEKKDILGFIRDLLSAKGSRPLTPQELEIRYTDILYFCDDDNDGRININEFKKLLKVEENHWKNIQINNMSIEEYSGIFDYYDENKSGKLNIMQIMALIHDIHEKQGKGTNANEQKSIAKDIMKVFDKNKDGFISKSELALMFPLKR